MDDNDFVYVETTEPEHSHYCSLCGFVWKHQDESCVGPHFRGYGAYEPYYDCPECVDN